MKLRSLAGLALLASSLLASCSAEDVRYLARAAYEEARILARREPIEDLLQGDLDADTRLKLELTLQTRKFAEQGLGLEIGGSYTSLARVDQSQIVYVVSAARHDRLEPYLWWFPIVGHVPYRGYFRREAAKSLARTLERQGFDTYVRSAMAFSTLGYFNDPLLSHLLRREPVDLVETILHELLHTTVYVKGQTAFNESFANFVGHRGAMEFFTERGEDEDAALARRRWHDALQFAALLETIVDELEAAYASGIDESARQQLFDRARSRYEQVAWQTDEYSRFATAPLNNAVLLARRVYFERLQLFETLCSRFDDDLARCVRWVIDTSRVTTDPYRAIAAALAAHRNDDRGVADGTRSSAGGTVEELRPHRPPR